MKIICTTLSLWWNYFCFARNILLVMIYFFPFQLITLIEERSGIELANKFMCYTPRYNYGWVWRGEEQGEKKMQKQDKQNYINCSYHPLVQHLHRKCFNTPGNLGESLAWQRAPWNKGLPTDTMMSHTTNC